MAQLKDLIVTGASRFIGPIYGTASGAVIAGKAINDEAGNSITGTYVHKAGDTMAGRLYETKALNMLITGSGTAATTAANSIKKPAKWTFNAGVTVANGDIFSIKVPVAGHTYGVYLSVNNGTNYYPVIQNGTTRISTEFAKDTCITVMYESGASAASIYPLNGNTATQTVTGGAFRVINYYNTTYSSMSQTEANGGTATNARSISAAVLRNAYTAYAGNFVAKSGDTMTGQLTVNATTINNPIVIYGKENCLALNGSSTNGTYTAMSYYLNNHTTWVTGCDNTDQFYVWCNSNSGQYYLKISNQGLMQGPASIYAGNIADTTSNHAIACYGNGGNLALIHYPNGYKSLNSYNESLSSWKDVIYVDDNQNVFFASGSVIGDLGVTGSTTSKMFLLNPYGDTYGTGGYGSIWYNGTTGVTQSGERANTVRVGQQFQAAAVFGAVWNDYAEFRETKDDIEPGRVIKENGDGSLSLVNERLARGCEIVSDTYGFAIGETEFCKTPTAATGRVLAYPYEDIAEFKTHIGWPVCSGPNGTVSIMTEEEEAKYASRIIGTISEIPNYEIWNCGEHGKEKVKVNGRVWIRVR